MSFSIQTNVNSLVAQENLRVNSNFQSQTIQRLTSGYRINSSADDAAGLAVANKFRSDVAELSQGVRNANDGVSQLQIMDGGMNNIGKMLDRLKTLATQSASDSFTGNRSVLNKEYQSLVNEIDRQAQSIGLSTGGHFAKSLNVFIGGGVTPGGVADTQNGTVGLDLANSAVDSKALGLRTAEFSSKSADGTNLALASNTSIANIVAANNAADSGKATFKLSGAGFSNLAVTVTLTANDTTKTTAAKLNSAIQSMANSTANGAANLAAANIQVSAVTNADGTEVLQFSSANKAFQVSAGTNTANALLGHFDTASTTSGTGASVNQVIKSGVAVTGASATENNVKLTYTVNGTTASLTQTLTSGDSAATVEGFFTAGANYNTLLAAGIKCEDDGAGGLKFTGTSNQSIQVMVEGDTNNFLGLGSWSASGDNGTAVTVGAFTAGAVGETETLGFSINGGDKILVQVARGATIAAASTNLQNAINANADLKAAGLSVSAAGAITSGAAAVKFRVTVEGKSGAFDMGYAQPAALVSSTATFKSNDDAAMITAGGSAMTGLGTTNDVFSFAGMKNAGTGTNGDQQVLSFTALDADGKVQTVSRTLTSANAGDVDTAIATLNTALQADNTLKNVVAVKETTADGNSEGIRFISSLNSFSVNVGKATNDSAQYHVGMYDGTTGATATQGMTVESSSSGAIDISSKAGAKQAVVALGEAVTQLGVAQAAVGKGQNQLNYAIGLAQSQITNFSSAQAQIRDADVASEAANLTKAQVLQQASIAAMSQANSAPQAVLSLLRG